MNVLAVASAVRGGYDGRSSGLRWSQETRELRQRAPPAECRRPRATKRLERVRGARAHLPAAGEGAPSVGAAASGAGAAAAAARFWISSAQCSRQAAKRQLAPYGHAAGRLSAAAAFGQARRPSPGSGSERVATRYP